MERNKMKLRKLQDKDAPLMLEWMHDPDVVKNLSANFAAKTLADCCAFIESSGCSKSDLHLAIVDDTDQYMGTVSLKHIDQIRREAEFAITIRACAMGKGYSRFGMQEIIRIGLEEMDLLNIYWCVSPENKRAVRFYDKCGYRRIDVSEIGQVYGYSVDQIKDFFWYTAN